MPEEKLSDDRPYGFIFGGVHLTENGKVVSSVAPVSVYTDMNGAHVQSIWKWLIDNKPVNDAMMQFAGVLGRELNALSDTYMVATGKADDKQLKEFGEMLKKHYTKK